MNELAVLPAHTDHPRNYRENRFVYPVLSRRSKGISIGINLNPDKICNFDCVYCQVDRSVPGAISLIDLPRLLAELDLTITAVASGELFRDAAFAAVPHELRRLQDIAFSGDGEPTAVVNFAEIVTAVAELKRRRQLDDVRLVVITNATLLHRPGVQHGLDVLMAHRGQIWAKLDAGTEAYYRRIERTSIPFRRVLENLEMAARRHPLVIQSMFLRYRGEAPGDAEIAAYIGRLEHIVAGGGVLELVQVYTVARPPAESVVEPLTDAEVDAIADRVRARLGIPVESHYGRTTARGA